MQQKVRGSTGRASPIGSPPVAMQEPVSLSLTLSQSLSRSRGTSTPRAGRVLASLLGSLLQLLLTVAVLGAGFAALRNVFSDSIEVGRLAKVKACAEHSPPCHAQMTRWERSAIGQTFDMYTPSGTIVVRCQREYYLVGDYRCTLRDAPTAITAEPPAPAPKPPVPPAAKGARQ